MLSDNAKECLGIFGIKDLESDGIQKWCGCLYCILILFQPKRKNFWQKDKYSWKTRKWASSAQISRRLGSKMHLSERYVCTTIPTWWNRVLHWSIIAQHWKKNKNIGVHQFFYFVAFLQNHECDQTPEMSRLIRSSDVASVNNVYMVRVTVQLFSLKI